MRTDELRELLTDLVAIPSVNRMGSVDTAPPSRAMLNCIEPWLETRGVKTERQSVPGGEENLVARLGPPGQHPIIFDAHTDTVPAEGWEDRAFAPRVEGTRLYGRGACDTKGSMAAMMMAMADVAHRGAGLQREIVFVATADEEYLRTGVRAFLRDDVRAELAIVGEPTCLDPVVACKGAARWEIVVPGRTAHSSRPGDGVNAVGRMKDLLIAIEEYISTIASKKRHPLVDSATLTPTMVRGGTAPNVVPASCVLYVDLRTMPGEDPAVAMREAREFLASRCPFPLEHRSEQLWYGADLPGDHPLVQRCVESCRTARGKEDIRPLGVNYGCHASDYAARGIPAVVLGPGDIRFAHAVDEYVDVDDVAMAAKIYFDLMTRSD